MWNVLMVSSDPSIHSNLKLQKEERLIRKCLEISRSGDVEINFEVLPAATVDDLAEKLLVSTAKGLHFDIVHFSGHCSVEQQLVQLIFHELYLQHGADVFKRLRSNNHSVKGVQELAMQVVTFLESQATSFMDEWEEQTNMVEFDDDEPLGESGSRSRSRSFDSFERKTSNVCKRSRSLDPAQRPLKRNEDASLLISNSFNEPEPEGDPLVLRLPDVNHTTKDIVLTKDKILNAGVGSLAFETEEHKAMNFVGVKAFANLLSPYPIGCVLINACHALLVCEEILSVGVPMAICCKGRMSDCSALQFSAGFYGALAAGHCIERCFREGRHRIEIHALRKMPEPGGNSNALVSMPRRKPNGELEDEHHRMCLFRANGNMKLSHVSVRRHHQVLSENSNLKSMIKEGMKLLGEKDLEIASLRRELDALRKASSIKLDQRPNRVRLKRNRTESKVAATWKENSKPETARKMQNARNAPSTAQKNPQVFSAGNLPSEENKEKLQKKKKVFVTTTSAFGSSVPRFSDSSKDPLRYESAVSPKTKTSF